MSAGLRFILRTQVRARWRAMVGLALLLAVMSGAAYASAAGARRTHSAYLRFVERYRSFDVSVATGGDPDTPSIFERVARLPQVERGTTTELFNGLARTAAGDTLGFPDLFFVGETAARDAGDMPRGFKLVSGRPSDPARRDEAIVSYAVAERLGLHPGERFDLTLVAGFGSETSETQAGSILVTGIFAAVSNFETLRGTGFPMVVALPPAATQRWRDLLIANEGNFGVILKNGEADAAAFERAIAEAGIRLDGPPVRASSFTPGVQRLNNVPVMALWVLCGVLVLATVAIFGQALARELRSGEIDSPVLRALGLSRRALFLSVIVRAALVAVTGAVAGLAVAITASPLLPIGLARIAEPSPGVSIDPLVFGAGVAAAIALVLLLAVAPAWRVAAARGSADPLINRRPSSLASLAVRSGIGVPGAAGVQMAVTPGRGRTATPVRGAMAGAAVAIAALLAALSFSAGFARLQREPRLAGYVWDAVAIGFDPPAVERLAPVVGDAPEVAASWRGTVFPVIDVGGLVVPGISYDSVPPVIAEGRAPRTVEEIALDGRTMRVKAWSIGDRVPVRAGDGPVRRMIVTGRVIAPRIPFQPSENPEQGAFLTIDAMRTVAPAASYEAIYIRFKPGIAQQEAVLAMRKRSAGSAFAVFGRNESATIRNVDRISQIPVVLALLVTILGVSTLVHALVSTIRRRRRDIAVLRTIGFVRRQVRETVLWQAATLVGLALAVGVPIGLSAGRLGWRLFAEQIDIVPAQGSAWLITASVAAGALLVGEVAALFPAAGAARTQPAQILRTE